MKIVGTILESRLHTPCTGRSPAQAGPFSQAGSRPVEIPSGDRRLRGTLAWPCHPSGFVLLARGRDGKRADVQSARLAAALRADGLGTLLLDRPAEPAVQGRAERARELLDATTWLAGQDAGRLPLGYLGIRSGAAVALEAAAASPRIEAVVVCGGQPGMSVERLSKVQVPTLLIVTEADHEYFRLGLNRLGGPKWVTALAGDDPLWESPGTLAAAGQRAAQWFVRYLVMEPAWRALHSYA